MKGQALSTGTRAVYRGGSRSKKLRRGERVMIAAKAPNKDGTWRYGIRTAKGFKTWLAGRYLRVA